MSSTADHVGKQRIKAYRGENGVSSITIEKGMDPGYRGKRRLTADGTTTSVDIAFMKTLSRRYSGLILRIIFHKTD